MFLWILLFCESNSIANTSSIIASIADPNELRNDVQFADQNEDWRTPFYHKDSSKSYVEIKADIMQIRASILNADLSEDSLGSLFKDLLVFKIIPYWYGTPWTFEGHTSIPNQGQIACGYFVSTALLHSGLNVNRYKLAQQLPLHEAASLALFDSVLVVSCPSTEEIIAEMELKTVDGIYFLGFDQSHVGFLFRQINELYVIHANYIGGTVAIERIDESPAFAAYRKFYICPLSTNQSFLKKWKNSEVVTVIETPKN